MSEKEQDAIHALESAPFQVWQRSEFFFRPLNAKARAFLKVFPDFNGLHSLDERERSFGEKCLEDVDGSPIWLRFESEDLPDGRGAIEYVWEVSHEKRLELAFAEFNARLIERNTEMHDFTRNASHDLREPLRKISSYADFLERDLEKNDNKAVLEDLDRIHASTRRMDRLIESLMKLSRIGSEGLVMQKLSMAAVRDFALEQLESRIQSYSGSVLVVSDELPELEASEELIIELYLNLLSNALRYADRKELQIRFTVQKEAKFWTFGVKDNGIGFESSMAEKAFLPFRSLRPKSQVSSSGIGLSICRKIVERHGGRIWAESEPGKGCAIYFTLPDR